MYTAPTSHKAKTCCVAGYGKIPDAQLSYARQAMRLEVELALAEGYQYFLTSLTSQADQLFAEAVNLLRQTNPTIRLEAILPYRDRYEALLNDPQSHPLITACTDVCFTSHSPMPNCALINQTEQLRRASRMIAIYDGRDNEDPASPIQIALSAQLILRIIPLQENALL